MKKGKRKNQMHEIIMSEEKIKILEEKVNLLLKLLFTGSDNRYSISKYDEEIKEIFNIQLPTVEPVKDRCRERRVQPKNRMFDDDRLVLKRKKERHNY